MLLIILIGLLLPDPQLIIITTQESLLTLTRDSPTYAFSSEKIFSIIEILTTFHFLHD